MELLNFEPKNERLVTPEDLDREGLPPAIMQKIMGNIALEYYVPVDPMDDLQCDSCQ